MSSEDFHARFTFMVRLISILSIEVVMFERNHVYLFGLETWSRGYA